MKLPTDFLLTVEKDISLRPLSEGDADALFALVDANRKHLREFLGWVDHNTSKDHTVAFIKSEKNKWKAGETMTLAITLSDELVGLITLDNIDHLNQCASIGYWIAQNHQGRGLMLKSAQALISCAFEKLKLHRLEIRCALNNNRSQKTAESLGFTREGTLKEAISHYGNYFDAHMYGLVKA